jgi:hypothetical protein
MTLQRDQIDVLLDNLERTARSRYRDNPDDPTLSRDIVDQTRALLRTVELDHHLHICDYAQHLLLTIGQDAPAPEQPAIMHAVSAHGEVANLGIPLLDDPFDLDAYLSGEADQDTCADVDAAGSREEQIARDERRRAAAAADAAELRRGLSAQQLATLDTMALFGWKLEFVRRPMFQPPVPVALDRNRQRFVVVAPDGSAGEDPEVRIRA